MAETRRRARHDEPETDPQADAPAEAAPAPADESAPPHAGGADAPKAAEYARLQMTLSAEDALRLDTLCKVGRKTRGQVVSILLRQATPGFRAPTVPAAVKAWMRAG